ncbi:MAG: TetR/AcrR family transcriptional regulator [Spirochaetales bacterium]
MDSNEKKNRIFKATLDLIAKKGFHGASMLSIALKARVAAGTIYTYFKSKEDLIDALYLHLLEQLDQALLKGFRDNALPEENLKNIWLQWLFYYVSHPKEFLFLEQYSASPFISKFILSRKDPRMEPAVEYLSKLKHQGYFKDLPDPILVGVFYGPIVFMAKTYIADRKKPSVEEATHAFNACLEAIRRKEGL